MWIISRDTLPAVRIDGRVAARIFDGDKHGGVPSSAFVVEVGPGQGPPRHTHPYDEVFVVVAGAVRVTAGSESAVLTEHEIAVVPAGVVHGFTALGPDQARLVNIHAASTVVTEFVANDDAATGYEYGHAD